MSNPVVRPNAARQQFNKSASGQSGGGAAPGPSRHSGSDDDNWLTPGLIGMCLATFVGVGGCLYALSSGYSYLANRKPAEKAVAFVSKVDAVCSQGWKPGLPNVDEMHCYMTDTYWRLCDEKEQKHLLTVIARFEKDYIEWDRRLMAASFGSMAKTQAGSMQLGLDAARMERLDRDPNASFDDRMKAMEKVTSQTSEMLSGVHAVLGEKRNNKSYGILAMKMTELVEKGYMPQKDLARLKAKWVVEALKDVKSVKPPACRT